MNLPVIKHMNVYVNTDKSLLIGLHISENIGPCESYRDRWVYPYPDHPEYKARSRRIDLFQQITGLQEYLWSDADAHRFICKKIPCGYLDHTSFWTLGKTPLVLVEPYESRTAGVLIPDDLFVIEIPIPLAPYSGFVGIDPPIKPDTRSYLFCNKISRRKLQKLKEILDQAAENRPHWSYFDED